MEANSLYNFKANTVVGPAQLKGNALKFRALYPIFALNNVLCSFQVAFHGHCGILIEPYGMREKSEKKFAKTC